MKEEIFINGKKVSKEELCKKQKEVNTTKGLHLVEISPNNFRIRIQD